MSGYKNKKLWVISDVRDEAKDEAKRLSKLNKKKIGEWLSEFIMKKDSTDHLVGHLYNDSDLYSSKNNEISKKLDRIFMEINDIHNELATLATKVYPMPKKTFFDKFLK